MTRIRPLQLSDLHAVLRIQDACYTEIVPESLASLRAKAAASPGSCFVAEAEAGIVGYLISVPIAFPELPALGAATFALAPGADTLYLHDLAVGAAGRGTGAGQALVAACMDAARRQGFDRMCLVAIQDSVPYWRRHGFEVETPAAGVAAKLASYGPGAKLMVAGSASPERRA